MQKAMSGVQSGEITTSVRNVELDGVKVKEGQIIGLHNGKLVVAEDDVAKATLKLLEKIGFDKYEIATLFYGEDLTVDQANVIVDAVRKAYPKQELEVQEGGQSHYHFILAIE
jgi:dihydroxyacetone kinase-like predicted kinase